MANLELSKKKKQGHEELEENTKDHEAVIPAKAGIQRPSQKRKSPVPGSNSPPWQGSIGIAIEIGKKQGM